MIGLAISNNNKRAVVEFERSDLEVAAFPIGVVTTTRNETNENKLVGISPCVESIGVGSSVRESKSQNAIGVYDNNATAVIQVDGRIVEPVSKPSKATVLGGILETIVHVCSLLGRNGNNVIGVLTVVVPVATGLQRRDWSIVNVGSSGLAARAFLRRRFDFRSIVTGCGLSRAASSRSSIDDDNLKPLILWSNLLAVDAIARLIGDRIVRRKSPNTGSCGQEGRESFKQHEKNVEFRNEVTKGGTGSKETWIEW